MPRDPREYITVVAAMPDHPKVEGLSDAAFRLLVESWCWCKRQRTDGFIAEAAWKRRKTPRVRAELLSAGLVEACDGGVLMHDYAEHQWTEAQAAERSAVRAAAGAAGGRAKAAKRLANASDLPKQVPSNDQASAVAKVLQPVAEEKRVEEKRVEETKQLLPAAAVAPAAGAVIRPVVDAIEEEFATFWQWYPRKVGRAPALKAYRAARRKVDRDTIAAAFRPFLDAMQNRDADKVPHAATWLNREPWHDDPDAIAPTSIHHDRNGIDWDAQLARAAVIDQQRGLA